MNGLPEIGETEYRFVAELLHERFGIYFGNRKKGLVAGRLAKRLRALGLSNFSDYVRFLQADKSGAELAELINRLTTNHSYFFREMEHFDFLGKEIIPPLLRAASRSENRELRIWSAGCAAGEEAHSIAMAAREVLGADFGRLKPSILATDISLGALKRAEEGIYPEGRFGEMPRAYLQRYFKEEGEGLWRALPSIHDLILFKPLNLMVRPLPFTERFDLVFCRNVMIYFDSEARRRLVSAIHEVVKPGGYLFVGHAEPLQRGEMPFDYIKPAIYRRRE